MILRAASHRAIARLKAEYPDAEPHFYFPDLLTSRRGFKAYYKVRDADLKPLPKGVTRAHDQDEKQYGHCW